MTEETAVPAEADADAEATSAGEDRSTASGTAIAQPDNLPDKFWDAAAGAVRMDELVKSYRELENQFARRPVNDSTPIDSAEDYAIDVSGPVDVDPVVNGLLFEAGLNNDQVQVVYDLANRFFGEVAERVKTEAMLDHRAEMLERHFGGREKWSRARDQIRTWADRHLPKDVVDQLAYSFNGVLTLQRLMALEEPGVLTGVAAGGQPLTEKKLRERMRDPRYWRDHDPTVVREIQEGFERLYPKD